MENMFGGGLSLGLWFFPAWEGGGGTISQVSSWLLLWMASRLQSLGRRNNVVVIIFIMFIIDIVVVVVVVVAGTLVIIGTIIIAE